MAIFACAVKDKTQSFKVGSFACAEDDISKIRKSVNTKGEWWMDRLVMAFVARCILLLYYYINPDIHFTLDIVFYFTVHLCIIDFPKVTTAINAINQYGFISFCN